MAYSVFVSHGWDDRWVALQIANNIRSRGADVFIDMFDIQSGDRIEEKVHAGITGCNELISLLTPRSVSRNWVWAEIAGTWILRKRYVAVTYGLTREEINKAHGGLAMLASTNVIDINDLEKYLTELAGRVKDAAHD